MHDADGGLVAGAGEADERIARGTAAISAIAGGAALGAALGSQETVLAAAVGALVGAATALPAELRNRRRRTYAGRDG
jgi:hypothetical protein